VGLGVAPLCHDAEVTLRDLRFTNSCSCSILVLASNHRSCGSGTEADYEINIEEVIQRMVEVVCLMAGVMDHWILPL
jgi:hypothetical protein